MEIIEIKTLIDITNSNVTRISPEKETEFNQYKNWNTLLQCIGLRCIILYDENPSSEIIDIASMFGSKYRGKHKVWTFRFKPDRQQAYEFEDNKIGHLINDLHQVPIIEKLSETINISKAVFDLEDRAWKNTLVSLKDTMETR
jgi:hypothetical protein